MRQANWTPWTGSFHRLPSPSITFHHLPWHATGQLDAMDRKVLETIAYKFDGGPVGIDSLATAIGEEGDTIEDVYEPFLILKGFLKRTPRGRVAMPLAYQKLGAPPPDAPNGDQPDLL